MDRVYARQTANGAAPSVARNRILANDRPNAVQVAETKRLADVLLPELPLKLANLELL